MNKHSETKTQLFHNSRKQSYHALHFLLFFQITSFVSLAWTIPVRALTSANALGPIVYHMTYPLHKKKVLGARRKVD